MAKCLLFFTACFISTVVNIPLNTNCAPGEESFLMGCKSCEVGYYSRDGLVCKKCSTCLDIQTLLRKCISTEDTFCLCPEGTYLQNNTICSRCQKCEKGTFQVVDCSHNFDRVCQKCPRGQTTNGTNSKTCFVKPNPPDLVETKKETVIKWPYVVGGAALVSVLCVVFLIYYLLVKRFKTRKRFIDCRGKNVSLLNENVLSDCATEFNIASSSECANQTWQKQLKDVPADVLFELGKKLNPAFANNWKVLAGQLGYTYEDIAHFDLSPKTATVDLLHDWSTGENATLNILYNKLILIKRPDAAEIVRPYL
ncbi:tumor necrosis factor receptor superfamily member 16-like precursor [Hydra vulgaris]|uniref:Tumor necrosis factor receptor superfamily member 16-like precursor n=1 Tax=Hydra vulgaris TaxID=6087 RepID=D1M870_HYDVU|nr:tumor necrosis factor receptor superfamily member 16-like precursor [Hydra vulgaris]ACY71872.1 p75-like protein [Hydra vulgaris]